MIDSSALRDDLQALVTRLENDLRTRCGNEPDVDSPFKDAWEAALKGNRTAQTYAVWRDGELTQVAVGWVLACVFVRFIEDNGLVEVPALAGPGVRLQRARDEHELFFRANPTATEREYFLQVFESVGSLPGMREFFDRKHNPLWRAAPSGDAARALLDFWRRTDPESGRLVHDFTDPDWGSRFLGDLYQDLSEAAKKKFALLQTPDFIEEFILDRTLGPAIGTFGYRVVRLIDPTCGSGHFLLGAFARLFRLWQAQNPGENPRVLAQHALDAVFGVDLNPYAAAIARFRLLLAALRACGVRRLKDAPDFRIHVAVGDSLLHGRRFRDFEANTGPQRTFDTEEVFRDELKHHYEVEDVEALHRILGQQYHAVVGNPPYITVKDRAVSELYRARYLSCHRKYSLSVPFMERFFDLAVKGDGTLRQPAGFVGQITANSFMKRGFGKKLVEEFLPRWDLTHILDTAGTYIPGHNSEGTPTVVLFGKNQTPVSASIRAVLGIRGETSTPSNPVEGHAWKAILHQVDQPETTSEWVSSVDIDRQKFAKHPWSIGGGGASELKSLLDEEAANTVRELSSSVGYSAIVGDDDIYVAESQLVWLRKKITTGWKTFAVGDTLRDWGMNRPPVALYPHDENGEYRHIVEAECHLWAHRTQLRCGLFYGKTKEERGLDWRSYAIVVKDKLVRREALLFAFVATHNHFIYDQAGVISNKSAPGVKLSANADDTDHVTALGVLNSSSTCFWLRAVAQAKSSFIEPWETRYEFDNTKAKIIPFPAYKPSQLPTALVQTSTTLQGYSPAATLAGWGDPGGAPLRDLLAAARDQAAHLRRRMIAWQEELDWQIYEAFGLIEAGGRVSLPEGDARDAIPPDGIDLGERAFEIVLARRMRGKDEFGRMKDEGAEAFHTTWFERHGSTPITEIPAHWPQAYRELVERRIARIADDANIRLIEQPEYKRRWNTEPWDEQLKSAARAWLLLRLETYFFGSERMKAKDEGGRMKDEGNGVSDAQGGAEAAGSSSFLIHTSAFPAATRPHLVSANQLAEVIQGDHAFLEVAEVLAGSTGFSVPRLVRDLVESESVPNLPVHRYKEPGLRKRRDWEETWRLQREEDAVEEGVRGQGTGISEEELKKRIRRAQLEQVGEIPVPPKYAGTDFKKPTFWKLRGKLDVPKERWVSYPGCERDGDPSPLIAWAGWDPLQQAKALAEYFLDAKTNQGWPADKLRLLLAGLLDLLPWLRQWHNDPDPDLGMGLGDYFAGFLDEECRGLGLTRDELENSRMGEK